MKFKFIVISIFCHILIVGIEAQNYIFERLGVDDGLSQVSVNCSYQDELGMMWFGTRDGLNRYDGNEIKVFKRIYGDTTSLNNANIKAITGDDNGYLYVLTPGEVVKFDLKQETFSTILSEGNGALAKGKNKIWIGVRNKLYSYNLKDNKLSTEYTFDNTSFNCIYESTDNICWIGTNKGLLSVDSNLTIGSYLTDSQVRAIYEDKNKNLWVCTDNKGLARIKKNGDIKYYLHDPNNPKSIVNNSVRAICEDNLGHLWIGSQFGMSRMDTAKDEFQTYIHTLENQGGLTSSSVMHLFKDKQGTIWAGTFFGGVNYVNPGSQKIRYYYPTQGSLPYPVIGKFAEDKNGLVWITTEGGGYIVSYNPGTKEFISYKIPGSNYKEIFYDEKEHCLWLGTHLYELIKFDISTRKTTTIESKQNVQKHYFGRHIWAIRSFEDKLLVGSTIGVALLDPKTQMVSSFIPNLNTLVTTMIIDSKRRLWIGTEKKGVFCRDLNNGSLTQYNNKYDAPNSLSSNSVNCIIEDNKQRIWIGTNGSGLNLFRPESNDFEVFTAEKDGLIDNTIIALADSKTNKILIGTNIGLSSYNVNSNVFSNFFYKNGFPLSSINEGSLFVSSSGDIFAGGVTGMIIFTEDDLQQIRKPFNIQFTKLYVNNQEVKQHDESGILNESLPYVSKINIKPGVSVFSIDFATDNYIKAYQDEVEYRLKGYESQWMNARFGRMITYTNLSPGEYTLELRAKRFPHINKTLIINVEPPFYRTWLAYILYALIIIGTIYWLSKQAKTRFYLKTSLEFEKKEKEKSEELTQSKLRFFTNISHEFRTPITLILGQTEHLLQSYNIHPVVYNKILSIHKNAYNLNGLINELLDFRKQEQGHLQLKISYVNIVDFIREIFVLFQDHAVNQSIKFNFDSNVKTPLVWIDTEQMQKVINNILSNAFKYTLKENGNIAIHIEDKEDEICIAIADTGQGILPDKIAHIFDRFYQADHTGKVSGTGIGLALSRGIVEAHSGQIKVESKIDEGSTFSIYLKKGDSHFEKNVTRIEVNPNEPFIKGETLEAKFIDEIMSVEESETTERSKLLIVEDNEDVRLLLKDIFDSLYHVETAVNGADGLEKARKIQPDLIISDIMMPEMSGIELCAKIKNNFDTCHIPVILLTAKTAIEHKFEGLRFGADDYITKPFDLKLLVLRCNNLINSRKLLKSSYIHQPNISDQQIATTDIDQKFIDKAMVIVEANLYNTEFNIDIFASEMGLGRTSLFNKLKGVTGLTPNNFMSNLRLKKSAELLINNPELNISEISFSLGFCNPRYFNKCFKDLFGYSPIDYRKNNRK